MHEPKRICPHIPPAPLLPPGLTQQYADLNGTRIWYARWTGSVSNTGDPVLLLHGGLCNSNYFGHLIRALIDRGHSVLAVDSRAQGRSPSSGGPITYDAMQQDVVALLDHLRIDRVSVVGWSDGGIVGLQLAIRRPQRLHRLFTFGANVEPSGNFADADSLPTMAAHAVVEREEYLVLSPTPGDWEQVRAAVVLMWSTLPQISAAQLGAIRVPTTICAGQYDECIKPEHTRFIAAQIPGSRLVCLPQVSHFAMVQDPELFNRSVLDFLSR